MLKTHTMGTTLSIGLLVAAVTPPRAAGPDATLTSHALAAGDGKTLRLADLRGEVLVVNFWATWCAPCHEELKTLDSWHRAWAGRGARVVAISIDENAARARRFAADLGLALTVVHDGPDGLAASLDLPSVPCTYLIDRDGSVVRVVKSSASDALAALRADAESRLSARPETQDAGLLNAGGTR